MIESSRDRLLVQFDGTRSRGRRLTLLAVSRFTRKIIPTSNRRVSIRRIDFGNWQLPELLGGLFRYWYITTIPARSRR